jgi:hypothetical protein
MRMVWLFTALAALACGHQGSNGVQQQSTVDERPQHSESVNACGPTLHCDRRSFYCLHVRTDVAGQPDGYFCEPYPDDCRSCECLQGILCEGTERSGITLTRPGG